VKLNNTNRYIKEFPYLSLCGKERNYIRCSDLPFVFTSLDKNEDKLYLNNFDTMFCSFKPELLFMCKKSGRIYYPLIDKLEKLPTKIGLIKSSLVMELNKTIHEDNEKQIIFDYKSNLIKLNNSEEYCNNMIHLLEKYSLFDRNSENI
jgi:hypothetical protein